MARPYNLIVREITPGSPAAFIPLKKGDRIAAVNGAAVSDELDLLFHTACAEIELTILRNNRTKCFRLYRRAGESLGIIPSPCPIQQCNNRCVFCFIDQLPRGLRKRLYIKDEDVRHSFLTGTYVTLTTVKEKDMRRISHLGLSPLYISVHATDTKVRRRLLGNPRAPDILSQLSRLQRDGISFHTQIVVCPGINDGSVLQKTLTDLLQLQKGCMSIAVVPVGLTRFHRNGVRPVTREEAHKLCTLIDRIGDEWTHDDTQRRVFGADELYLRAGRPIPSRRYYEDFPQYENGVGMIRTFLGELSQWKRRHTIKPVDAPTRTDIRASHLCVLTSVSASPYIYKAVQSIRPHIERRHVSVLPVVNQFFGSSVTVAGLLTARDVVGVIRGHTAKPETVIVPAVMFNSRGYTLDGWSRERISRKTGCRVVAAGTLEQLADCCMGKRE